MRRRTASTLAVAATLAVVAAALGIAAASSPTDAGRSAVKAPGYAAAPRARLGPESAGGAARGVGPSVLLPDVRSLRARDLQVRAVPGGRELRFAALLANDGAGPLVLAPRGPRQCPRGQRHADQLLYVDRDGDDRFRRRTDTRTRARRAGCMVDHPTHDHWHFVAMASYRLVDLTPRRRVVVGHPKVSFCLRDNRPVPGARQRQRREYFGECGRTRVQGISPGWVDVYDVDTPGQSLRLPGRLPDGTYCLVLRADPLDRLVEADEDDNTSVRPVRIRGLRVSVPDTGRCGEAVR